MSFGFLLTLMAIGAPRGAEAVSDAAAATNEQGALAKFAAYTEPRLMTVGNTKTAAALERARETLQCANRSL